MVNNIELWKIAKIKLPQVINSNIIESVRFLNFSTNLPNKNPENIPLIASIVSKFRETSGCR